MSELDRVLRNWVPKVRAFETEAHSTLGIHETSPSRVVLLDVTYQKLTGLNFDQDELFRQALRCVESGLFRAAHVMGWAAFMDFLECKLCDDGMKKLKATRPKWSAASREELRESIVEYQLIEAARDLGLCGKTQMKALHGLLNKRNECAHPSNFFPGLNETLGYLSELLERIGQIQKNS